jgi:hypothetical protein
MQVNKWLKYSMLAVYVGAGAGAVAQADPQVQMDQRDPTFFAGPVKITLGGFTELALIDRKHNEEADVGSSFYKAPFPGFSGNYVVSGGTSASNPQLYYEPEFRESARQSRFAILAQHGDGSDKFEYYLETDFLSAGTTSNSNESNSYTLRMRHFYGDWHHGDTYLLAGQTWSLASQFKSGLNPRKENTPQTIDAQYVVGFNWARQAQLRLVQNFGKVAALGISLEEPQIGNQLSGSAGSTVVGSSQGSGSGLLNPTATYSSDIAPDGIVKFEIEPGFGHYEVYSLTRFLHDRGKGSVDTVLQNHTKIAESIGASTFIPVVPKFLDFQASGIVGRGNGRYGSGQLGDAVTNPLSGALTPTREFQALVGLTAHATSRLDIYGYGGIEHEKATLGSGGTTSNVGCDQNPAVVTPTTPTTDLGCSAIIGTERQFAAGVWWSAYQGPAGAFKVGAQGSYLANRTLASAKDGTVGKTDEPMVFLSFRYYPFQ